MINLTGKVAMVRSIPPTAFCSSSTLAEVADLKNNPENKNNYNTGTGSFDN
jgi:hypothetical protein